MAAVNFTKHVEERLRQRRISEDDVLLAMVAGEWKPARRDSVHLVRIPQNRLSLKQKESQQLRDLRVVVGRDAEDFTIITAYYHEPAQVTGPT